MGCMELLIRGINIPEFTLAPRKRMLVAGPDLDVRWSLGVDATWLSLHILNYFHRRGYGLPNISLLSVCLSVC